MLVIDYITTGAASSTCLSGPSACDCRSGAISVGSSSCVLLGACNPNSQRVGVGILVSD
jgi:hypothetical protein